MARAHTTHEADCDSLARHYSRALLLLAIAGLLVACGGGAGEPGPASSGGVACTVGPAPAVLAWDAVTDPSLRGYRIYYGTALGTYLQPGVDVNNVTTYTVRGLSSGTTYYFVATAFDMSNNESVYSNAVCKTIS